MNVSKNVIKLKWMLVFVSNDLCYLLYSMLQCTNIFSKVFYWIQCI